MGRFERYGKQHFKAVRPKTTHWRRGECDMDCANHVNGWQTVVPTVGDLADWIRHQSGLRFNEETKEGLSRFVFPPGQTCFSQHAVALERDPVYIHEVRGIRTVQEPQQWIDTFSEEMHKLTIPKEI